MGEKTNLLRKAQKAAQVRFPEARQGGGLSWVHRFAWCSRLGPGLNADGNENTCVQSFVLMTQAFGEGLFTLFMTSHFINLCY